MKLAVLVAAAVVAVGTAVSHATTTPRLLGAPAWSPDGKHIAWTVAGGGTARWRIWVANADGSAARRLPTGFDNGLAKIAWAGPGTLVADGGYTLYRVAFPSGKRVTLTPHGVGGFGQFSIAHGRVAVGSSAGPRAVGPLTVTDVHTGKTVKNGNPTIAHGDPTLSPDGRRVAYDGLWVQPADGTGSAHQLVAGGGCPEWSPNGRTILYRDETDELRLIPATGGASGPRLARDPRCVATWSPDSVHFAVSELARTVIVDAQTHTVRHFPAKLGIAGDVAWSPDGRELLVAAVQHGSADCSTLWRLDERTLTGVAVASGCP